MHIHYIISTFAIDIHTNSALTPLDSVSFNYQTYSAMPSHHSARPFRQELDRIAEHIITEVPDSGNFKPAVWVYDADPTPEIPMHKYGFKYYMMEIDADLCPAMRYLEMFIVLPGMHMISVGLDYGTNDNVFSHITDDSFTDKADDAYHTLLSHI